MGCIANCAETATVQILGMFLLEIVQKTPFFSRFKTFRGVRKVLKTDRRLHFRLELSLFASAANEKNWGFLALRLTPVGVTDSLEFGETKS
jgi:hypothetical protein